MNIREQVGLMQNSQRLRIIECGNVIFDGFAHLVNGTSKSVESVISGEKEVKSVGIHTEIRHKHWKELGLEAPMKQDELPDYEMRDLQVKIYIDIELKE